MKKFVFLVLFFCCTAGADTQYWLGEQIMTSATGVPLPDQNTTILVERTLNEAQNLYAERAVQLNPRLKMVVDVTITLNVTGSNFTATDSLGTMTGNGSLTGAPWKWTYLSADYFNKNTGRKIMRDEDFMSDPNSLFSRKVFFAADGVTPDKYCDVTVHPITIEMFDTIVDAVLQRYKVIH
jgi:hypothetical protein